ncbi:MAG: sporulation protein YqfC [Oscillospiraceae bacterium]|nr:sporulation protein YqfC [Oscillospiraceae bacterium]
MKKKQDRGKKTSFMSEILEMPMEVSTGMPKITITGFEEILVENYKGILEYEEMFIRINTFIGVVNILRFWV